MDRNFLTPGFVPGSISLKPPKSLNSNNRFENRKIPLAQGKSLNDWIRLMNSGADLSGTNGKLLKVTEDDMKIHSELNNVWIILNGRVYNVAPYLEYHPGGAEELMRAAGTDATGLFNEIHPWVAWDSMLKACLVGNYVGRRDSLRTPDPIVKDLESLTVADGPKSSQTVSSNTYHQCKILSIKKITHDTNFYVLEPPEDWRDAIALPIGCHVYFKMSIQGVDVTRPYTLVSDSISDKVSKDDRTKFYFIIKIYQTGFLTKHLNTLKEGDSIEISDVYSPFNVKNLNSSTKNILLFAAGTGVTPFVRIINEILPFDKNIFLFYFNKTKRDIIWEENFSETSKSHSTFRVTHILSEPDSDWNGLKGRVNENMLKDFTKNIDLKTSYACVCGPTGFNDLTLRLLATIGCTKEQVHVFSG